MVDIPEDSPLRTAMDLFKEATGNSYREQLLLLALANSIVLALIAVSANGALTKTAIAIISGVNIGLFTNVLAMDGHESANREANLL